MNVIEADVVVALEKKKSVGSNRFNALNSMLFAALGIDSSCAWAGATWRAMHLAAKLLPFRNLRG